MCLIRGDLRRHLISRLWEEVVQRKIERRPYARVELSAVNDVPAGMRSDVQNHSNNKGAYLECRIRLALPEQISTRHDACTHILRKVKIDRSDARVSRSIRITMNDAL